MKTERRFLSAASCPVTLRAMGEGKPEMIGGMAAVYYDGTPGTEYELWNWGGERAIERILPGAFDKVVAEKQDIACLFNHDPSMILGRTSAGTAAVTADAKGLAYECDPGDTGCGKDTKEHLRRKDVTGSSFSFEIGEQRWTEIKGDGGAVTMIREIVSVNRVWDVGPVCFPAYTGTSAGMRSAGDDEAARKSLEAYRQQRQVGEAATVKGKLAAYQARARAVEID